MADEVDTQKQDVPKIVKKSSGFFKWLGGLISIPLLLMVGNYAGGMVKDGFTHIEELGNKISDQNTKIAALEANSSSREAIWTAITHNRDNHEAEKDAIFREMHGMSVKYEAAMLVFEKHFMGGGCMKQGPVGGHGSDLLLETLQKTLKEVQKAESADQEEIQKLHDELEKLKSQQSKVHDDSKRQAEILKALKDVPGLRANAIQKKLDAEKYRKLFEEKFPAQQQQQFQKP